MIDYREISYEQLASLLEQAAGFRSDADAQLMSVTADRIKALLLELGDEHSQGYREGFMMGYRSGVMHCEGKDREDLYVSETEFMT